MKLKNYFILSTKYDCYTEIWTAVYFHHSFLGRNNKNKDLNFLWNPRTNQTKKCSLCIIVTILQWEGQFYELFGYKLKLSHFGFTCICQYWLAMLLLNVSKHVISLVTFMGIAYTFLRKWYVLMWNKITDIFKWLRGQSCENQLDIV